MRITDLFEYFEKHKKRRVLSLTVLSSFLLFMASSIHFSEDINDFLPLGTHDRENMSVYQSISGADRLFVLFSVNEKVERTTEAIDMYVSELQRLDTVGWCGNMTYQIDFDDITEVTDFVYKKMPYFLTSSDIERMDGLLADPDYIKRRLDEDKRLLMIPASSMFAGNISNDPIGLFSPVLSRLQTSNNQLSFEMHDGYIFTPDMSRAIVIMTSPFGSSETENNSKLLKLLGKASAQVHGKYPEISIDVVGGPAIAVENSSRIKKDSVLAISLSVVLITLFLVFSFNSLKNILLIFFSVGWGLLFALGGIAAFKDNVSIIVIGISSVIIGLAVNYPLHLIAHTYHQPDRKSALGEIAKPLIIGNITTVGAFLALLPLKSPSLNDLGLFASLLLIGTILFVLIYLPHYVSSGRGGETKISIMNRLTALNPKNSRPLFLCVIVLTLILAVFSVRTEFDSNMSHINYMTDNQRADMQYFEDLFAKDVTHTARSLYIYGSGTSFDDALSDIRKPNELIDSLVECGILARQNEASSFIVSKQEQQERLERWNSFVERHRYDLTVSFDRIAKQSGFSESAFNGFRETINNASSLVPLDFGSFSLLTQSLFSHNFTHLDASYAVCAVNVEPNHIEEIKALFEDRCFDLEGMNSALTSSLSDNFNFIGWACSLIVFFFLWFSFGRFELALISFLPMAISWLWILGLMSLLGIKFNIVNIILASFIFGQGDDYTIFMTEGCQYEYSRHKPIVKAYKTSILQSALIMFVGIGTLIIAKHPALKSLAEVTIIGMFSVVLMAFIVPPFLFNTLTLKDNKPRRYPLTLKYMVLGPPRDMKEVIMARYIYKGHDIERSVRRNMKKYSSDIVEGGLNGLLSYECHDDGYGEISLLLALYNPMTRIIAYINDDERRNIAEIAAEGLVENIEFRTNNI